MKFKKTDNKYKSLHRISGPNLIPEAIVKVEDDKGKIYSSPVYQSVYATPTYGDCGVLATAVSHSEPKKGEFIVFETSIVFMPDLRINSESGKTCLAVTKLKGNKTVSRLK